MSESRNDDDDDDDDDDVNELCYVEEVEGEQADREAGRQGGREGVVGLVR